MRARQVHAGGACGRPHSANLPCSEGRRQARARRTCSCSPSTATDQHHLLTRVAVWMGSPAYTAASRHHHLLTRVAVWMTISSSRRGRAAAAGISRLHGRVPRRLSRLHLLTRVAVWITIRSWGRGHGGEVMGERRRRAGLRSPAFVPTRDVRMRAAQQAQGAPLHTHTYAHARAQVALMRADD